MDARDGSSPTKNADRVLVVPYGYPTRKTTPDGHKQKACVAGEPHAWKLVSPVRRGGVEKGQVQHLVGVLLYHWAHEKREDGCHSPIQVLAWHKGTMHSAEFLDRILFATRFTRRLDKNGYLRLQNWKLYGERSLRKAPFRSPQLAPARRRRRVASIMQLPLFDPEPIDLAVGADEGRDSPHPRSHLQLVEKPPSDQ